MASFASVGSQRSLRACMVCSVVQSYTVRLSLSPSSPCPSKVKGKLNICPALPRPWLPQLRGVPPPRRLPGPDRGLHVPGLRGRHHARRPEQVLGRQVAAPRQLPARRVRDQGVGPVAGRGARHDRGRIQDTLYPVSLSSVPTS
jgi:hypothetical protein